MKPILKKTRRDKRWLTDMFYCISLLLFFGVGGFSSAWAMRACPSTGIEWNNQAMEINVAYKDMQEEIQAIDDATPLLMIKQFDRKATHWMECLTKSMRQPNGNLSPNRILDARLVRTQVDLIDGLVRYAKTCVRDPDISCDELATIQVFFSSTRSAVGSELILSSSFRGSNPFGNTWENFLSVVGF